MLERLEALVKDGCIVGTAQELERLDQMFNWNVDILPDALLVTDSQHDAARLMFGGTRSDGYHVFGYVDRAGAVHVYAGCRDFTIGEALTHWSVNPGLSNSRRDRNGWTRDVVNMIKVWSRSVVVAAPPTCTTILGKVYTHEHLVEFFGKRVVGIMTNWLLGNGRAEGVFVDTSDPRDPDRRVR